MFEEGRLSGCYRFSVWLPECHTDLPLRNDSKKMENFPELWSSLNSAHLREITAAVSTHLSRDEIGFALTRRFESNTDAV